MNTIDNLFRELRMRGVRLENAEGLVSMAILFAGLVVILPAAFRPPLAIPALLLPGHAVIAAIFGQQLGFVGYRRVALSVVLSLTSYPILAILMITAEIRLTQQSVVISTTLLIFVCSAAVKFRERRTNDAFPQRPANREELTERVPVALRQFFIPVASITVAFIVIAASPTLFPRADAQEFTEFSLSKRWSLARGSVPIDPEVEPSVEVHVRNGTATVQQYTISPSIGDTQRWAKLDLTLEPGQTWQGSVSGPIPAGACRSRLEIALNQPGDHTSFDPLVLFFDDSAEGC